MASVAKASKNEGSLNVNKVKRFFFMKRHLYSLVYKTVLLSEI